MEDKWEIFVLCVVKTIIEKIKLTDSLFSYSLL